MHAAGMLAEREGEAQCPVVLIGSPKCRIKQELRGSVLYVYAVGDSLPSKRSSGASGKIADRISRLGTFGGWVANERGLPSWRMDKYAPLSTYGVPIIGGPRIIFASIPRSSIHMAYPTIGSRFMQFGLGLRKGFKVY